MVGNRLLRRPFIPAALALAFLLAAGCQDQLPTGPAAGAVPLRITASTVGTPIATLVVTVTASDITTPLVFNLTVSNGTASGTIKVPPGLARTLSVLAFDAEGDTTHTGSVTIDVRPGQNPPVTVELTPRPGQVPITVTFGNYGVVVTPTTAAIAVGATVQLTAAVTDAYGNGVTNPAVAWATSQPTVATVSSTGLVTGTGVGTVTIAATYEGVESVGTVNVGVFVGVSLAAGAYHACGLASGGVAYCWGLNSYGQLGDGSTTNRLAPVAVGGGLTFASLGAGAGHTCGLTSAGAVYCWGDGSWGQLGDGTTAGRSSPVAVAGAPAFASIAVGGSHTCALTAAGAAYCWGENDLGQLGDGTTTSRSNPTAVVGGLIFKALSAGMAQTCGLTFTGAAYCWGYNAGGQLGDGPVIGPNFCTVSGISYYCGTTPVAVTGGLTFASLAAGQAFTCGLTTAGAAWCWGFNGGGQLGDGTSSIQRSPVAVTGGLTFGQLGGGYEHTCGLTPAGAAWCWGSNSVGQLGDGTTVGEPAPVSAVGSLVYASLTLGYYHSCALAKTGVAYCWGANGDGQLGDGTGTDRHTPVPVLRP